MQTPCGRGLSPTTRYDPSMCNAAYAATPLWLYMIVGLRVSIRPGPFAKPLSLRPGYISCNPSFLT